MIKEQERQIRMDEINIPDKNLRFVIIQSFDGFVCDSIGFSNVLISTMKPGIAFYLSL